MAVPGWAGLSRRGWLAAGAGAAAAGLLPGCARSQVTPPGPGMTASVTYLHLLAKVPMFRAMSREQLQWVIDHSREWSVAPGAEVASSARGGDAFWTLLDGRWRIEYGAGRSVEAGHADPAKWWGGRDLAALGRRTRVVATAKSYVMEIDQTQLDEMLRRGLPLAPHLEEGMRFYRALPAA